MGIVIPALINGLSIPVFKNWLGASDYGKYALYFSALLITNLLVSGWLSQGILRFYAKAAIKIEFVTGVVFLAIAVGAIAFLPALGIVWWLSHSVSLATLFATTLWLAAIQLPLQSVTQSGFLSKAAVYAEAIRTGSWFGLSFLFLVAGCPFLQALFGALAISYAFSILYLYRQNTLPPIGRLLLYKGAGRLLVSLGRYGWPFSLWFICFYLSGYIDKLFVLQHFGSVVQGHYSALFDFVSKSLTLVLAPVLTAVLPLLTEAYEKGHKNSIRLLLKKLILLEIAAMALIVVGYLLFGYQLLFYFLHIPVEKTYVQTGLLMIAGTMIWQIALLLHKPMELKLQSALLFKKMATALFVQVIFYLLIPFTHSLRLYAAGYCLAAWVYLFLVFPSLIRYKN